MQNIYFLLIIFLESNFLTAEGLRVEKIIDGQEVKKFLEFKYIVAVMYKPGEGNFPHENPCTGTIISDWYIAAVAHCFYDKRTRTYRHKEYYIAASLINVNNPLFSTYNITVDLVMMPNVYDPLAFDGFSTMGNLAIVKLACNFGLRSGHRFLKKLRIGRDLIRNPDKEYIVSSFGWNEIRVHHSFSLLLENISRGEINPREYQVVGRSDGKLRFAHAKALNDNECQRINNDLAPGNMCVKIIQSLNERKGICEGDGGSPLVFGYYLIGIAINGAPQCNDNIMPSNYINAAFYVDFINDILMGIISNTTRVIKLKKTPDNIFLFEEIRVGA